MRMHAIDAPEMPGSCRPGRRCTPGDPYASRDYLRRLTKGREVRCEEKDVDSYGRMVVRCTADGKDLGCAMVAGGQAVERYGKLNCTGGTLKPASASVQTPSSRPSPALGQKPGPAQLQAPTARSPQRFITKEVQPPPGVPGWLVAVGLLLLAALNVIGFFLMRQDEQRAGLSSERLALTPRLSEPALLGVAAAGGSAGMLAASFATGHRLDDVRFSRILILLAGVQFGLVAGLLLAR